MSGEFRRIVLDGSRATDRESLYDALSSALGLSPEFGRNLDALWDALTGDLEGPVELVWQDAAASRAALGPYFERILGVLRAAEGARPDFRLTLR
jgi:ribonuclease inhibitor